MSGPIKDALATLSRHADLVADAIKRVKQDQTVRLQGWLVEIRSDDGWQWRSSLTREDSGDGACELIYVCEIESF